MTRRLPPLYPLRAFEAAARLGSISAAGRELSLTQSAVSHEVKALETYFGTALFRRTRSGLVLTRHGQRVFAVAQSAFADLSGLGWESEGRDVAGTVTIAAPPLFCAHWLLPRLDRVAWANPDVAFRILNVTVDRPELLREVDIAVVWGERMPTGCDGVTLMSATQMPVASPALIAGAGDAEPEELLRQHRILHEGTTDMWRGWCERAGVDLAGTPSEWVFDDPALMIEACTRGHGIALGTLPLIEGLLSEGRLVALFRQALPAPFQYFLTRPDPPPAGRAASIVFDWLKTYARSGKGGPAPNGRT
ncbi:LysR substrate-binding domain-containing protein [Defluviimonas salinarum]|uniref:LysR substrate-binding domain-containing protein n=1 Tax=Defluviimonas salinarum TaxID=2992147 RepID=A0ABT3J7M8_9RHOB|nr:LysR substrate-binding domain-containing protein [Defluviimonas salinarum]MCW3783445.1 LysR substrate-binding domain-containing protein [Defluviimonas salinarum]